MPTNHWSGNSFEIQTSDINRVGISRYALATAIAVLGSSAVHADPTLLTFGEFGGHRYEFYRDFDTEWGTARENVTDFTFMGAQGHLATITSEAEDVFIEGLRQSAAYGLGRSEFWIGGSQPEGNAPGPGDGWVWENDEGAIPGDNDQAAYANWRDGEPNENYDGDPAEDYLAIGLENERGWNDEGEVGNIAGFVVEYDIAVPVTDCIGGDGCETIPGQTLTFPATVNQDATIAFQSFEFDDPRVATNKCGIDQLVLFDGDLIIPSYLCGSPKFVVVKTDTDLELFQGTVRVQNDVTIVLPDNLYVCQVTPALNDPLQKRDVVVWQSTDKTHMLENQNGGAHGFPGSAGEFTNECINPSRGLVRTASFYVIGMHIDFGLDYETNSFDVLQRFVDLTRYKLVLLGEAIEAARSVLKTGDYTKMKQQVRIAIEQIDRDKYSVALTHVNNFLRFADRAKYAPSDFNHDGEHTMRGENIRFMLADKILPYAP